jgi:5-methyltetrahydrofolate--homocysteine methyltransferase
MARNDDLYEAIYKGDLPGAKAATEAALDAGADPRELLDDSLIPAMRQIGADFEAGEAFIPEMLIAARAMQGTLELVEPKLADGAGKERGTVAIGTVKGDLHDIGKNLVAMMLKGAGYQVEDLGADCAPEKFLEAVVGGANIVCISALLTTTMPGMKDVVAALAKDHDGTPVVIGGAPVTREFADSIGAVGFAMTANGAVGEVERCLAAS